MSKEKQVAAVVAAAETSVAIRTPDVIASEIRFIDSQARQYVLQSAIEIGNKLIEVKALVGHGEWGSWLEANVSYRQSTANNFMKVASEYANSHSLANLNYSQAVALLSVPAEEREAFVEENNASEMSTRELQAAIKAKAEAERQLKEEQERAQAAEEQAAAAKAAREVVSQSLDDAQKENRELDERLSALQEELEKAKAGGDDKALAKSKMELRKAEKAKTEQENKVAELQKQLEAQKAEAEKTVEERLQQREQELAEQSIKRESVLQDQLDKLNQQLQRSNNEAFLRVKLQLQQIVTQGDVLVKAISDVSDPEEQIKLKTAAAKVVDQLRGML